MPPKSQTYQRLEKDTTGTWSALRSEGEIRLDDELLYKDGQFVIEF